MIPLLAAPRTSNLFLRPVPGVPLRSTQALRCRPLRGLRKSQLGATSFTMTATDHNKIVAIGLGAFAAIFLFTFVLLIVVSVGVFAALGITAANEPGNGPGASIGIIGVLGTVIFYGFLTALFVLPPALAAWKMLKHRENALLGVFRGAVVFLPQAPVFFLFSNIFKAARAGGC